MRSERFVLAVAAACMSAFLSAAAAAAPAESVVYVSPRGSDAWSGRFPTPLEDGSDGPFATLERARDEMRTGRFDTARVRGGVYHLRRALALGSRDSDHEFEAYPGEEPILSGGEPVPRWQREGNDVFSAPLAEPSALDLVIDGVRQTPASTGSRDVRDPARSGWLFAVAGDEPLTTLTFDRGVLVADDVPPGAAIQVMNKQRWRSDLRAVANADLASGVLKLDRPLHYKADDATTFRLLGNAGRIAAAGEFGWRMKDRRVVVRLARGETPTHAEVPRLGTLIDIVDAERIGITGLTLVNTTHDGAAIRIDRGGGEHRIVGNVFRNVGQAVWIDQAPGVRIRQNSMRQLAADGIQVVNADRTQIIANEICDIGRIHKGVAGASFANASNTVVAENVIAYSPRYGIDLTNWGPEFRMSDNTIAGNRILHTSLETADSGAITMFNPGNGDTRTIISGNEIRDTGGLRTETGGRWISGFDLFGTSGIYLDDLTNGVRISGNLIVAGGRAAITIHGGQNNVVEENIAVLKQRSATDHETFVHFTAVEHPRVQVPQSNRVRRNVVFAPLPLGRHISTHIGGCPSVDENILFNVVRADLPGCGAMDMASLVVDPRFVAPTEADFRLRPDSPAWQLGSGWFSAPMADGNSCRSAAKRATAD